MRKLFYNWNCTQIGCESERIFECPNSALAKNNFLVSTGKDIFCRHQPFLYCCRRAALKHYRLPDIPDLTQQRKILHVPRTDLDDVGELSDSWNMRRLHYF